MFLDPFNTDRDRAKESFRRLAERGVTTVCFGHGGPLLGDRAGLLVAAAGEPVVPDRARLTPPAELGVEFPQVPRSPDPKG